MSNESSKEPPDERLLDRKDNLLEEGNPIEEDFSDLETGWAWVVVASCFGSSCLFGASQFASGIIHLILLERYQASVSLTSIVGAIHMGLFGLGGPISSAVIDRFSCRVAVVTAGFLFAIGCIGTALSPTIEIAIVMRGVIGGIGGAVGFTANMVIVGFYFRKRRNLAVGVANSGVGVGIFILAPAMQKFLDFYGPFGFFIILAGVYAQMIIFGVVLFPSKLERYAKTQRQRNKQTWTRNSSTCNTFGIFQRYVNILKNKSVICLSVGLFNYCLGSYIVYLFLPSYIVSKGFTDTTASNLISLTGILTVIGRLITGSVANLPCSNETLLYCASIFITGASTFIYPSIAWSHAGNLVYAVILGLFFGNCYVLTIGLTVKYVEVTDLSLAISVQYLFGGIGTVLGPAVAGLLIDVGISYDQVFYITASCMVFASIVSGAAACFTQPCDHLDNRTIENIVDTTALKETKAL